MTNAGCWKCCFKWHLGAFGYNWLHGSDSFSGRISRLSPRLLPLGPLPVPSAWKKYPMILCKVILDTCLFILGYIAKYPWMLSFPEFHQALFPFINWISGQCCRSHTESVVTCLGIALLQLTLLPLLVWRCLPFGAAKISFLAGFPQASFIHRQKR